jgi:mannose-6-phosphate isomerase-like protein (cupin superfamily)
MMKTQRPWGHYTVLHQATGMKVKELVVDPGQSLSMQRHFKRNEFWIVQQGACQVNLATETVDLSLHGTMSIPVGEWHQLTNPYETACHVVEIQYGNDCVEEDIERRA